MKYYVYVLYTEENLPFYIGRGTGSRWLAHERNARKGEIAGNKLKHIIIKRILAAGLPLKKEKVKQFDNLDDAGVFEVELIKKIGRIAHGGPLVNRTDGGEGGLSGMKHSAATRARMSASMRGTPKSAQARINIGLAQRGRKAPPGHMEKMTAAIRGKPLSAEHRDKLSKARMGKPLSKEHIAKLRGKKRSAVARSNISASLIGRRLSDEHRRKLSMRILTEEHKIKISKANLGRKLSFETRTRMKEAWKIRRGEVDALA